MQTSDINCLWAGCAQARDTVTLDYTTPDVTLCDECGFNRVVVVTRHEKNRAVVLTVSETKGSTNSAIGHWQVEMTVQGDMCG